jgi:hypothetical protein
MPLTDRQIGSDVRHSQLKRRTLGKIKPELVPPKVLEPIRRQLRVANCVLDVLVPHPGLDRTGIVAGVRQCIAAAVASMCGWTLNPILASLPAHLIMRANPSVLKVPRAPR